MAILKDDRISGAVGNVVFYTLNGQKCLRAKPRSRVKKRGKPANPLNTVFGAVSRYGSIMIKNIKSEFHFPFIQATYNTSRGWMRNFYMEFKDAPSWDLQVKTNNTCQLNAQSDLRDFIMEGVTVNDEGNGLVGIHIPPINPRRELKAPAGTAKVNLKLVVVHSSFGISLASYSGMKEYSFAYTDELMPAQNIVIDSKQPSYPVDGRIALVVMALEFEMANGKINMEQKWLPAALIAMGRLKG